MARTVRVTKAGEGWFPDWLRDDGSSLVPAPMATVGSAAWKGATAGGRVLSRAEVGALFAGRGVIEGGEHGAPLVAHTAKATAARTLAPPPRAAPVATRVAPPASTKLLSRFTDPALVKATGIGVGAAAAGLAAYQVGKGLGAGAASRIGGVTPDGAVLVNPDGTPRNDPNPDPDKELEEETLRTVAIGGTIVVVLVVTLVALAMWRGGK